LLGRNRQRIERAQFSRELNHKRMIQIERRQRRLANCRFQISAATGKDDADKRDREHQTDTNYRGIHFLPNVKDEPRLRLARLVRKHEA
jgi:hypothetical protein